MGAQGDKGMGPLHAAVWEGNAATVAALLAAKASVALKSRAGGFTALHAACLSPRVTPELVALLLGAVPAATLSNVLEERSQEGWTALHLACQVRRYGWVRACARVVLEAAWVLAEAS